MAETEPAKDAERWRVVIILSHGSSAKIDASRAVLRSFKMDWVAAVEDKSIDPDRTFVTCHGELGGQPKELYLRLSEIKGMVLSRVED